MKYYYIKVDEYINGEWMPYGYFEQIVISDCFQGKYELNITTVSEKECAKKYIRKGWAERKIQEILDKTKDNIFLYRNNKYVYKFKIVEE